MDKIDYIMETKKKLIFLNGIESELINLLDQLKKNDLKALYKNLINDLCEIKKLIFLYEQLDKDFTGEL